MRKLKDKEVKKYINQPARMVKLLLGFMIFLVPEEHFITTYMYHFIYTIDRNSSINWTP